MNSFKLTTKDYKVSPAQLSTKHLMYNVTNLSIIIIFFLYKAYFTKEYM